MPSPVIGVLAVQGDIREHTKHLELAGATAVQVRRPKDLAGLDGIVIPGGESTTMVKLLQAFELFLPLQELITQGLPAYGSCAGMILLARKIIDGTRGQQSLGGIDMVVRRNAFGRQVDSSEQQLLFAGIDGEPLNAVFIRAPWVEEVGSKVEVLARTTVPESEGKTRIVAVRQGSLLATSFHPELTPDIRVHQFFLSLCN